MSLKRSGSDALPTDNTRVVDRQAITSAAIATPVGPVSPAVLVGQDPSTGTLVVGDTAAEAEQALRNLASGLAAAGLATDVGKVNAYLADTRDFVAFNAVYERRFRAPYSARTTVAVAALPLGARVEIEAVARARVGSAER